MPSPNIIAAGLARRTSKAAICVIGNSIALYNPPIRVAEEFAMLDVISGGRLIAGFPVGTSMDVNFCYGVTPTETRPRFREALDLIMQAWTKPGPFTFNGRYNQLRYVNPWPKPLQKPYPPVWLAGGGSVETWELAATQDYTYSYLSFFGYQFAQKLMSGFWETMDRMGIDQNPYRAGFAQQICVSETDERAEEEYMEHVTYFFNKCLHIPPYFFEAPGYRTRKSTEFAIRTNQPGAIAATAALEKNWTTLNEEGVIIAGSPSTVADRLIEVARTLRVGNLHALLQIGSMPHELTKKNITLFAEEVMPRIRHIWDAEGWTHEWWPSGAASRAVTEPEQRAGAQA